MAFMRLGAVGFMIHQLVNVAPTLGGASDTAGLLEVRSMREARQYKRVSRRIVD